VKLDRLGRSLRELKTMLAGVKKQGGKFGRKRKLTHCQLGPRPEADRRWSAPGRHRRIPERGPDYRALAE